MRKVADVVIIQHKALLTFAATAAAAASRTTNNGRVENNTACDKDLYTKHNTNNFNQN